MEKIIFFAFRGDPMCFVHVLLNSIDLNKRDMGGKIVLEGEAVKLVGEMARPDNFLNKLYLQAKKQQLILGACRACSAKLDVTDIVEREEIPLIGEMMGHPAMADYMEQGYKVLTF